MAEGLVYEIRKSKNPFARKPWYWRCVQSLNNEVLCHSQSVHNKADAVCSARLMMTRSGDAKLKLF